MLSHLPPNINKICINTGNILSLNEVKKKAGQNPTDEVSKGVLVFHYVKFKNGNISVMLCRMIHSITQGRNEFALWYVAM
jgi:uncharacterized protein with NRDE domain